MNVSVLNTCLLKLTTRLQGALGEKGLAYIALRSAKGKLFGNATDRAMIIYSNCECKTTDPGLCFVPAKLFCDVVRELPSGQIHLKSTKNSLLLSAETQTKFAINIPLLQGLEWRETENFSEQGNTVHLQTAKLLYLFNQVKFCILSESPRNYGTVGFLHKPNAKTIRLVGTDGFRLSYSEMQGEFPKDFLRKGVCLPKKMLNELQRVCQEGTENVAITLNSSQTMLKVEIDGYSSFMLLSSLKYPKYQNVLPSVLSHKVKLPCQAIQNALRRVMLAADKSHSLQISFLEEYIRFFSKTSGSTEGHEEVKIDKRQSEECIISLNGKFLSDVIGSTVSEYMMMSFQDKETSLSFLPEEEPLGCRSAHILVPIRENG
jgi:DNA polymerase III subunit beta